MKNTEQDERRTRHFWGNAVREQILVEQIIFILFTSFLLFFMNYCFSFFFLCHSTLPACRDILDGQRECCGSMNAMIVKFCSAMNVVLNVDPPHQDETRADFRVTLCRALISASVSSFVDSLQAVVQSTTAPAHFAACLMRGFYLQHLASATTAAVVHSTNKKDLEGIDETRTMSLFHMEEGLAEDLGARFVAVHGFWEHLPRYVEAAVHIELFPHEVATMHSEVAERWEAIRAHCKDFSDLDRVTSSITLLIAEWRSKKTSRLDRGSTRWYRVGPSAAKHRCCRIFGSA